MTTLNIPGSPSTGDTYEANGVVYTWDDSKWTADSSYVSNLNGGQLAGFRNTLINGTFTINQRGYVSGANTTQADQYTVDRWAVVVSGQQITWTFSPNYNVITAPAGGLKQVIEGNNVMTGPYCLSWTGTATATVNGSAVSNGGVVNLTGGDEQTVIFSGGTVALPQFEPGPVGTIFENRPRQSELALCQRYYYKSGQFNYRASNSPLVGVGVGRVFYSLPSTMRADPTVDFSGANLTGGTISLYGNSNSEVTFNMDTTQTIFDAVITFTADAEL